MDFYSPSRKRVFVENKLTGEPVEVEPLIWYEGVHGRELRPNPEYVRELERQELANPPASE